MKEQIEETEKGKKTNMTDYRIATKKVKEMLDPTHQLIDARTLYPALIYWATQRTSFSMFSLMKPF